MKQTHESMTCAKVQALIEAYVDEEITPEEGSEIDSHLKQCSVCAQELWLAKRVCNTLRALPVQYCPEHVKKAVLEHICGERETIYLERIRSWFRSRRGLRWRPAFAAALLLALVVTVMLISHHKQPSVARVSPEELVRAEIEAKWTIAYVGEISQRTGIIIRDDVIDTRVMAPMKQAFDIVLDNEPNNVK